MHLKQILILLFTKKNAQSYHSVSQRITGKIITTSILILFSSNTYSQDKYSNLFTVKYNYPTVIINDNIISNENFVKKNKSLINQISIMKQKPNRKEHKFYNLSEYGVLFVKTNKKIKTKTQCELNRFFGIDKKNKIYINGYLVENRDYKIATESIIEIELILPNSINN